MVSRARLERATAGLEIRCSIQLSYRDIRFALSPNRFLVFNFCRFFSNCPLCHFCVTLALHVLIIALHLGLVVVRR